jgi:hypothetical protein
MFSFAQRGGGSWRKQTSQRLLFQAATDLFGITTVVCVQT